jgi:hypothetical protein
MSDATGNTPHFLRVVRALAKVRGTALPLVAVTTVVAGFYSGCSTGRIVSGSGGDGGASASSSHGSASGGLGGHVVGVIVMRDGG